MHVYGELTGVLTPTHAIQGTLTIPTAADVPVYEGPYEFTPTEEAQTVEIENLMATQDITIEPIPSNYGLITWDGATLTVS